MCLKATGAGAEPEMRAKCFLPYGGTTCQQQCIEAQYHDSAARTEREGQKRVIFVVVQRQRHFHNTTDNFLTTHPPRTVQSTLTKPIRGRSIS